MDNKKEAPKAKTKKPAAIEETEVKKGPKWGILIPLIVILTICGSVGGTVLATHFLAPKTEQASSSVKRNAGTGKLSDEEKLVSVPKFVVNLVTDDPANTQYARLKISVLVENDDKAAEAKKNMAVIRDAVINVMKKKKATDILSNSGSVTALKNELKDGINEELGETLAIQVYVTDLVVQ